MSKSNLSFFDEKRRVSKFKTDWGFWWQTVSEVHIEVNIPSNTSAKDIKVKVNPKFISCTVKGNVIFEGELPRPVYADELIWTIEEGNLCILLAKADHCVKDDMWESLLANGQYKPDPLTLHETRKNLDLERFQIENPGLDFSGAKLSKNYDKLPGWSNDRLMELQAQSQNQASF
ncbi:NudC domain-containing protein, putative [Pediculus humanus corporis]|uniref:NudC domain-containing protein, putative n=1 Tax=Pediculus humanus subsp. corporis TaxID=121224 RepID=E0VJL7_PEDHC|nr:NudC domain-containing protein, putative [Pediculus humanus corporis]EEB13573.1 NudC domain-containing protein, putative [Pediculus humanus corporis]